MFTRTIFVSFVVFVIVIPVYSVNSLFIEPCTGEPADTCGFLPSTYMELGLAGEPLLCQANCTLGYDLCGVCGGIAPINQRLFEPVGLLSSTRLGGSVANWNGTFAIAQHIAQVHEPLVDAPVITWNRDESQSDYDTELSEQVFQVYELPSREGDLSESEDAVPLGKGYGLVMSEHYMLVGSHDSHPRELQLWLKTTSPPWTHSWNANDPCPGNRYGFSVALDERIPKNFDDGVFGVASAGDPGAFFSGRVYVYFTYSPGLLQTLFYGFGNETELACFGHSLDADSGFLAVGAPALDFSGEEDAGSVFLYRWDPSLGVQGEYTPLTQVIPPTPEENGGFGIDVALYENTLVVGDNQGNVYHYLIGPAPMYSVGLVTLEQPNAINLETRLGNTVSTWGEYVAAGDEEFVPQPTYKGSTFLWDRNPTLPSNFRLVNRLDDPAFGYTINTRYGADVDLRGGCFLVVGVTAELSYGGAYLVDLCRDHCVGCDNVTNSCAQLDECGVCLGDNSTCTDCLGVVNGPAQLDACSVCEGTNTTCVLPYSDPGMLTMMCEQSDTVELRHELESQHGAAEFVVVAPLPTKGTAVVLNSGIVGPPDWPTLVYQAGPYVSGPDLVTLNVTILSTGASELLMVPVSIGVCLDCLGVADGPARPDECGVCLGDNSTCAGCDGVPNSGLQFDYCMVCGGDNSTCLEIVTMGMQEVDCTAQILFTLEHEPSATPVHWEIIEGPFEGTAFVNLVSGTVLYENAGDPGFDWFVVKATSMLDHITMDTQNITFTIDNCTDCSGAQYGTQLLDLCGICGGNSISCIDCQGVPNGPAMTDVCGVCNGDGTSCLDCLGVPFGSARFDVCGICAGDNSSCGVAGGMSFPILIVLMLFSLFSVSLVLFCVHQRQRATEAMRRDRRLEEGYEEPKPFNPETRTTVGGYGYGSLGFNRRTRKVDSKLTSVDTGTRFRVVRPNDS